MLPALDVSNLLKEFKERISDIPSLQNEPDWIEDTENLARFLKSRSWDVESAEKMFRKSVEWRRTYKPFASDCRWCHENPGTHSLRQVGFDEGGRPVIYASFIQSTSTQNSVVDSIAHLVYTIENAVKSMSIGVTQWTFVLDCVGMTVATCHPRLGYECAQVMATHYPERLGLALCIHPGAVFKVAWKALKPFLPEKTVSKVHMIKTKSRLRSALKQYFSSELADWLMAEVTLNRKKKLPPQQRQFWLPPSETQTSHDLRGEASYVRDWLKADHITGHKPHPNILDQICAPMKSAEVSLAATSLTAPLQEDCHNSEEDDLEETNEEDEKHIDIPSELLIPLDAEKLS